VLAFPLAVVKKYGFDGSGRYAAMLAYYGFFSVLPLLLVLVTVLGIVLQDNRQLQEQILNTALARFPVIGTQLQQNIHAITGNTVALVVGILGALWGGLGVMQAAQTAMNAMWRVPVHQRPNYAFSRLRSLAMLGVLGGALLASTALSISLSFLGDFPVAVQVLSVVASLGLAFLQFMLAYKLLTSKALSWREVLPGSVAAGAAWVVLLTLGGYILNREVKNASALYGFFGVTIGMLIWISLSAQVMLYGAEINAVIKDRLWPVSLTAPPPAAQAPL
jgi:membrane protein